MARPSRDIVALAISALAAAVAGACALTHARALTDPAPEPVAVTVPLDGA